MTTYANFADTETFYLADERRRWSAESDFGVWWKDAAGANWRVSWVQDTGDIYAVRLGPTTWDLISPGVALTTAGSSEGPLLLLGNIPKSKGACSKLSGCTPSLETHADLCPAYHGYLIERVLEGWADACGRPGSFDWIKERINGY